MFPTDSDPRRVLSIGDSHSVLSFGDHLRNHLMDQPGLELHQYAASGSHLLHWMGEGLENLQIRNLEFVTGSPVKKSAEPLPFSLPQLISSVRPDQLIIALGTNDLLSLGDEFLGRAYQQALTFLQTEIKNLVWILPPRMTAEILPLSAQGDYQKMLQRHWSAEHLLVSDAFTPDQADGIHFRQRLATQWAEAIWSQYLLVAKTKL